MRKMFSALLCLVLSSLGTISGANDSNEISVKRTDTDVNMNFQLNDNSPVCEFKADICLPDNTRGWMGRFIDKLIYNDLNKFMFEGLKVKSKKFKGNVSDMNALLDFYSAQFKTMYEREFRNEKEGPIYSYILKVEPVWESKDHSLVTFRFSSYCYFGGAHGMSNEWDLTFSSSGKELGYKDMFVKGSYGSVLRQLTAALWKVKGEYYEKTKVLPSESDNLPYIKDFSSAFNYRNITEKYQGLVYPRPAFTETGVSYSYQPYEKGPYSEGIIRIEIPYKDVMKYIRPSLVGILE